MATKEGEPELDMDNRDPNELHQEIQVLFEDVIGEPVGAHSHDCVWSTAFKCFNGGKSCCYTVLTFICAVPLALCWGCQFAVISFTHIWQVTPCLKSFYICSLFCKSLWTNILQCCCYPVCEGYGLMLSKISITQASK